MQNKVTRIEEEQAISLILYYLKYMEYGDDITITRDNTLFLGYTIHNNIIVNEEIRKTILCLDEKMFIKYLKNALYIKGYNNIVYRGIKIKDEKIGFLFDLNILSRKMVKRK